MMNPKDELAMAKAREKGKVSYGDNLYEIHGSY